MSILSDPLGDVVGVVRHQLGLLSTDFHSIAGSRGLVETVRKIWLAPVLLLLSHWYLSAKRRFAQLGCVTLKKGVCCQGFVTTIY